MANRTASLIRNANLPGIGWRRGTLIQSKNGRIKDGFMLYNGVEYPAPQGTYQVRHYIGSKAVYVTVGNDLNAAQVMLERLNATRAKEAAEITLGIAPAPKPEEDRKAIEELKLAFLKKRTAGASKSNTALYTITVESFCKFVAKAGKTLPQEITGDDVYGVYLHWKAQGRKQYTCSNRYSNLRGFLHFLGLNLKELIDPVEHAKMKFKPKKIVQTYTDEEIKKLIAVSSERHALVWETFWKFGFRDEELAVLEWSNIDWVNKTAEVKFKTVQVPGREGTDWRSKDSEERSVPVEEKLLAKLEVWRQKNPKTRFVFGTRNDVPDIKFLVALKSDWRKAGLNCGQCAGCLSTRKHCSRAYLHKFRATYLTRMFRFCDNPRDVMLLAGHSSIETSLKYLQPSAQPSLQRAANAAWA
jgi:integrase